MAAGQSGAPDFDLVIDGGTIVTPEREEFSGCVAIRQGKVAYLGPIEGLIAGSAAKRVDASGCLVVPGLIDLHVHGAGGFGVAASELSPLSIALASHGITAYLATITPQPAGVYETAAGSMSSLRQGLEATMAAVASAIRAPSIGARLLGLHLEGPFLSPRQPGCLDPRTFRLPDRTELRRLIAAASGTIKRMTMAVELPGAVELFADLTEAGIEPSIGHSEATFDMVGKAVASGLRQATHVFNAMPPFHHRSPSTAGAVLHYNQIRTEVIADGHHVHPKVIEMLYRLKGAANIALVSDAVPPAGLGRGWYEWEGRRVEVENGVCRTPDGHLAGSASLLDVALRTLSEQTAIPPRDAIRMAALTPAEMLGTAASQGSLLPGKDGDVTVFDRQWRCRATVVQGQLVYEG